MIALRGPSGAFRKAQDSFKRPRVGQQNKPRRIASELAKASRAECDASRSMPFQPAQSVTYRAAARSSPDPLTRNDTVASDVEVTGGAKN